MTPPFVRVPGDSPAKFYPVAGDFAPSEPGGKPSVISQGDSFVRLDDSSGSFANVQDLLKATGDEQLFGSVANAKYQPERDKKYLKVTLALMEIRKYLRGDEKKSSLAPKRIEDWLNDAELLGDTVVAHQARVNLIKALKRAPKDAGIDEGVKAMLASLGKNYAPKAEAPKADPVPVPVEKSKDAAGVLGEMSDAKLFGEKLSDYDAKRNKDFLAVTVAILEVRKFVRGDSSEAETAKTKIAAWLNDYNLLTGEIPHRARVALIKALEAAPQQSEAWNRGAQEILATLKAKYTPVKPEAPAEPPKEETKPKEDPPKDEKPKGDPPPADKPKAVEKPKEDPKALLAKYVFAKFTFGIKAKREDTDQTLVKSLMATLRPTIDSLQAKDPSFNLQCDMTVKINNDTGEVLEAEFGTFKVQQGKISVEEIESALQNMAERFHTRYRFLRGKDDKGATTIIEIPLNFAKKS